jgi:hypothetical protein
MNSIDYIKKHYDVDENSTFNVEDVKLLMREFVQVKTQQLMNDVLNTTTLNRVLEAPLIRDEILHCNMEYRIGYK